MSAPLKLCGLCGNPVKDHKTFAVKVHDAPIRLCDAVDPKVGGMIVRDVEAWPLGGGKWQVRS